jgi:hypothetical protein
MTHRTNLPPPPIARGKKKRKKSSFVLSADVIDADADWITQQKKLKNGVGEKDDEMEKENIAAATPPISESAEVVKNARAVSNDVMADDDTQGRADVQPKIRSETPGSDLTPGEIKLESSCDGPDVEMAVEEDAQRVNGAIEPNKHTAEALSISPVIKNDPTQNNDRELISHEIPVDMAYEHATRTGTPASSERQASAVVDGSEKRGETDVHRTVEEDWMDVDELPRAGTQVSRSSSAHPAPHLSPGPSRNRAPEPFNKLISPHISPKVVREAGGILKSHTSVSPELSTVKLFARSSTAPSTSRTSSIRLSLEPIAAITDGPGTSENEQPRASSSGTIHSDASASVIRSPALSTDLSDLTSLTTTRHSTPSFSASASDVHIDQQQHQRAKSEMVEQEPVSLLATTAAAAPTAVVAPSPTATSPPTTGAPTTITAVAPTPTSAIASVPTPSAISLSASQPSRSYRSIARSVLGLSSKPSKSINEGRRQVSMPIKLISSRSKLIAAMSIQDISGVSKSESTADRVDGNEERQQPGAEGQDESKDVASETPIEESAALDATPSKPEQSLSDEQNDVLSQRDESMDLDSDSELIERSQSDSPQGSLPEYGSDQSVRVTKRGGRQNPGTTILFVKLPAVEVKALRMWRKRRSNPTLVKTNTPYV